MDVTVRKVMTCAFTLHLKYLPNTYDNNALQIGSDGLAKLNLRLGFLQSICNWQCSYLHISTGIDQQLCVYHLMKARTQRCLQ